MGCNRSGGPARLQAGTRRSRSRPMVARHHSGDVAAEYRAAYHPWRARGVRVSVPHGSLLIHAGDLAVHVIKAPGVQLREPEWNGFIWDTSGTRHAAAIRNAGMDGL